MHNIYSTFVFLSGILTAAPVSYQVTVFTSSFIGQSARADFQFNPGGIPDPATALLSTITGAGAVSEQSRTGDVTGTGPWTFGNTGGLNQLVLNLNNLSPSLSFQLTLSGPALDSPASFDSTGFFFTLLDSIGTAPLNGFNQPSLWFDISQGTALIFAQDTPIAVSGVPEPATYLLTAAALAIVFIVKLRWV